ncbi:MAG: SDR family oxidoreductase [Nannocystis sp.]|nr:SDR family oxidoreductase [Nannocystis sp.]
MATPPQRIFLTGAASGIGAHLADTFLKKPGHRVFATDIAHDRLRARAHDHAWPADRSELAALDVRDPEAWRTTYDAAIARFGAIDLHLNVAGYLRPGWILDQDPAQIDEHLDINLKGVIHGATIAARHMVPRRSGHIINIASLAGIAAVPGIALYSAAKHGVRGFSLALAQELAASGVAVTVLCPDAVQTPMLDLQVAYDEAALTFSGPRPLTVEEVTQAILTRVLPRRPIELAMPPSRAWMARLAALFPGSAGRLRAHLEAKGRARQAARRAR